MWIIHLAGTAWAGCTLDLDVEIGAALTAGDTSIDISPTTHGCTEATIDQDLDIPVGTTVTLTDLTVVAEDASSDLSIYGTLNLVDVALSLNGHTCIRVEGGSADILRGSVSNGGNVSGSAVYNNGGTVSIDGTEIRDCSDAAILSEGVDPSLEIDNATFLNNDGAIKAFSGLLTITATHFEGNNANEPGGALKLSDTVTEVTASTFFGNHSTGGGGAISSLRGSLAVSGSTFVGNIAGNNGGSIAADTESSPDPHEPDVTISDCTFTLDSAGLSGGSIAVANANAKISGTTVTGSTAEDGGSLYASSSTVTLDDAVFDIGTANFDGGHIYGKDSSFDATSVSILAGSSASGGGAYLDGGSWTGESGTWRSNNALDDGGALFATDTVPITLADAHLEGNTASLGGAVHSEGPITIEHSLVCAHNAGGLYLLGEGVQHHILQSAFVDNLGGAIRAGDEDAEVTVDYSTFVANDALLHGALDATDCSLSDSIVVLHPWGLPVPVDCDEATNLYEANDGIADSTDPTGLDLGSVECSWESLRTFPFTDIQHGVFASSSHLLPGDAGTDGDGDGASWEEDCDDDDPDVHPTATEYCNGIDDDCNHIIDDDGTWYEDTDGNGLADTLRTGCPSDPADVDALEEQECGPGLGIPLWYPDDDGDGLGVEPGVPSCLPIADHAPEAGDCAPDDPAEPVERFADLDEDDAYGTSLGLVCVEDHPNTSTTADDCDDLDPTRTPSQPERCNGVDDDCDGVVDEAPVDPVVVYEDADGDGLGAGDPIEMCTLPTGSWSLSAGDCDDDDPTRALDCDTPPGATPDGDVILVARAADGCGCAQSRSPSPAWWRRR